MPTDIPPVADRGIIKIQRIIKAHGEELKVIRNKGFTAVHSSRDRYIFRGMYTTVENTYSKFCEKWEEAIDYCETHGITPPFPTAEDDNYRKEIQDFYFEIHSFYLQVMETLDSGNTNAFRPSEVNNSTLSRPGARAILPKIPIKTFDGELTDWPSFKQLFTSLIGEEPSLTDAERFHYLISYLSGPAQDTVRHIAVVGENFGQAWDVLLKTYDDPRKLACVYLERFLSYKSPPGEPSAASLQAYLSHVTESVSSLRNLNIPDLAEYLLCEMALRNLDAYTRREFEISIVGTPFPKFTDLRDFVQNRFHVLQMTPVIPSVKSETSKTPFKFFKSPNKIARQATQPVLMARSSDASSTAKSRCHICRENHGLLKCPTFQKSTPAQRLDLLRRYDGCRNCLANTHRTKDCTSSSFCRECRKRHHTELHLPTAQGVPVPDRENPRPSESGFAGANTHLNAGVLLSTVVAQIQDANGRPMEFRGILDAGSHFSFITEDCARRLRKSSRPFRGAIAGVNHSPLQQVKGQISVTFLTPGTAAPLETDAIIVPTITPPLPQSTLVSGMWEDYLSYSLSDPEFTKPGPIAFLIGADLYADVVTGGPITLHEEGPRLMPTVFGYTVIGRYSDEPASSPSVALMTLSDLSTQIAHFWELEEPAPVKILSPDEDQCEQHFLRTHYRENDGRYVVSLPFRTPSPNMIPNTKRVLNCFYALESRLAKNESLREMYHAHMQEYIDLGHMSPAKDPPRYLVPHHAVFKEEGENRKLRVVYDASFPTATGSLNDQLLTGPKLQADITAILLNFRQHRYVFRCDIVKMFRQVWLNPADRCYQQIVWRNSPNDPVQFFELNTISFGMSSSPYLAQRVLRQHAINCEDRYPNAAAIVLKNSYVDDIIAGSNDPEHLRALKEQLIDMLEEAGFELGKWCSNLPSLLHSVDVLDGAVTFPLEDASVTKILGMKWDPATDVFSYETSQPPEGFTKRVILSTIARLYDPLGLLSPIVFYAKCLLQNTWQLNLDWDDVVPNDLQESWSRFTEELRAVHDISIPRAIPSTDTQYQFICFCDASGSGYCANVYLRATQGSSASLTLLKAKTKVAPLKTQTIPRLELCGALLLSQLLLSVEHLRAELKVERILCFTDSRIVLSWLHTPPHLMQIFVANRVQRILENTEVSWWFHCKGVDNPADVGSRGISPAGLRNHPLWWSGPDWCQRPIDDWPISSEIPAMEDLPELKPCKLVFVAVRASQELVDYARRFSSFTRFIRVMALIKRFIANSKVPKLRKYLRTVGPVTAHEFQQANHHYIRVLQHLYYAEVFTEITFNNLSLELRRLNVFVDASGLIRVGGRLLNAPIPFEQKHPILLPARSFYTNLVVDHYHSRDHHTGPAAMLTAIQQQYWIPKVRNLIKLIRHRCVVCTRFRKSTVIPFMGDLPKSRFSGTRPFLVTGVDFAGPFTVRVSALRKATVEKTYLCLFICMSSRALHLEVATSLSVEGFLDVFDRFIARRGLPAQMLSDGGTNFRGTVTYLQEVLKFLQDDSTRSTIINHTSHLGVEWNFNPPSSPHFGGGWEVAVRMVKELLHKTFGDHCFTLPELMTAFAKIEGILNSRPLQAQSNNPIDLDPLTPGHFLIGQPLTALPEPDFGDIPPGRLNRWQLVRERVQYFWKRWREEYLSSLQLRQKWDKRAPNLKPGDMVLLRDDQAPPAQWPLGRILEVHAGIDSIVRVVTVKTAKGQYKRPAVKMIPLTLEDIHA